MSKNKVYEVKDYYSRWDTREITLDMNKMAREGYEIRFAFPIDYHNEVNRYSDPLPGLNDGDHISSSGTMRVIYVK